MVVKVRTSGTVINRPAYVVVGVDVDGRKHVLGVWLGEGGEGAKFWLSVLTEIRNRGLEETCLSCAEGPGLGVEVDVAKVEKYSVVEAVRLDLGGGE